MNWEMPVTPLLVIPIAGAVVETKLQPSALRRRLYDATKYAGGFFLHAHIAHLLPSTRSYTHVKININSAAFRQEAAIPDSYFLAGRNGQGG